MFKLSQALLVAIILGLLSQTIAFAEKPKNNLLDLVVPMDGSYGGKTYSQLTEAWFQWVALQSAERDAIADPDGRFAADGQSGAFWFLAGTYGGAVIRQVTIPKDKAIFFPIMNIWAIGNESPPVDPALYWSLCDDYMDRIRNLKCEIDGVPIRNLDDYAARSGGYPDTWSADFVFYSTPPDPAPIFPALVDGYWILIQPLPPGEHTIHFAGKAVPGRSWIGDVPFNWGNFKLDVTYHITVGE